MSASSDDDDYEDDEYYDEDDEYDDSDDGSFVELPSDVDQEMERRREAKKAGNNPIITSPPPPDMLPKVRKYFLEDGGKPFNYGGFLDICDQLGITPSANDPLVKRDEYNCWYLTMPGDDDQEEEEASSREGWRKRLEQHEGRVRLLRYQEFIQHQESTGLGIPSDWAFDDGESRSGANKIPGFLEDEEDEEDVNEKEPKSSLGKMEYDLEHEFIVHLGQVFTMGFYYYVNHDKIYSGLAPGTQQTPRHVAGMPQEGDMRTVALDASLGSFLKQSQEMRDRYKVLRCPLGAPYALGDDDTPINAYAKNNKKKKGKKKGRGGGGGANNNNNSGATHAGEIKSFTDKLLEALYQHKRPSYATGQLYLFITQMLVAGTTADVDLARALLTNGTLLLKLRKVALDNAVLAEGDLTRPKLAADVWWHAEGELTALVCTTVRMLVAGPDMCSIDEKTKVTPDGELALEFYKNQVQPAFLESLRSQYSREQTHAVYELGNALLTLPVPIAFALVKNKEHWALLESLCEAKKVPDNLNPRQTKRETEQAPNVPAQMAQLLQNICCRGLKLNSEMGVSLPGKLVRKMTERGCVPLLISMANSSHDPVSLGALAALGDISRNKECRLLMLQDPNGVAMIRDIISKSTNASKVSPALLLIVHLLWDEEWRDILVELDDPPIEQAMVRWAAFAMREIRSKAFEVKENAEKGQEKLQELMIKKFQAKKGTIEAEQAELEYEEFSAKLKNQPNWLSLEVSSLNYLEMNALLRRSLMVLCHLYVIGYDRMKKAGILQLVACCIDSPDEDTYGGCLRIMQNFSSMNGREIEPSDFMDPDHVLASIITRIERFADDKQMNQTAMVYMTIAGRFSNNPRWIPCFDRIAAEDEGHKFTIDHMIKRTAHSFASMSLDDNDTARRSPPPPRRPLGPGVDGPTGTLSGRLAKCDGCGKIEGKRGDLKNCSKCKTTNYCDRDCQLKHWRQGHKKQCAKLAALKAESEA